MQEAESRISPRNDDDELSASIAALQQRNKRGFSVSHMEDDSAPHGNSSSEEEGPTESPFSFNTDSKTDDLMAAINRLTTTNSPAHRKKSSWDRAPQFFAHV